MRAILRNYSSPTPFIACGKLRMRNVRTANFDRT